MADVQNRLRNRLSQLRLPAIFVIASCLIWGYILSNPLDQATANDQNIAERVATAVKLRKNGEFDQAHTILSSLAYGPSPQAKYHLAYLKARGWGTDRDLDGARELLLQAVRFEFPDRGRAAFDLGKLYRKSNGPDCHRVAFEWYYKAASWGYGKAHNELAKAYQRGLGVTPSFNKALFHYQQLIDTGSTSAVVPMVDLVAKGTADHPGNLEEASTLLVRYLPVLEDAARGGNARAGRELARLFRNGVFIEQNTDAALNWFSEAARLGDTAAMHDLAMLVVKENLAVMANETVIDLLVESANRGYSASFTALGRLHERRWNKLTRADAISWFERGVEAGHAGSMEELARLYSNGDLVAKDLARALELAKQGAELKHKGAQRLLSELESKTAALSNDASVLEEKV